MKSRNEQTRPQAPLTRETTRKVKDRIQMALNDIRDTMGYGRKRLSYLLEAMDMEDALCMTARVYGYGDRDTDLIEICGEDSEDIYNALYKSPLILTLHQVNLKEHFGKVEDRMLWGLGGEPITAYTNITIGGGDDYDTDRVHISGVHEPVRVGWVLDRVLSKEDCYLAIDEIGELVKEMIEDIHALIEDNEVRQSFPIPWQMRSDYRGFLEKQRGRRTTEREREHIELTPEELETIKKALKWKESTPQEASWYGLPIYLKMPTCKDTGKRTMKDDDPAAGGKVRSPKAEDEPEVNNTETIISKEGPEADIKVEKVTYADRKEGLSITDINAIKRTSLDSDGKEALRILRNIDPEKDYFRLDEGAKVMGIGERTLRTYIQNGDIPAYRPTNSILWIARQDIHDFIKRRGLAYKLKESVAKRKEEEELISVRGSSKHSMPDFKGITHGSKLLWGEMVMRYDKKAVYQRFSNVGDEAGTTSYYGGAKHICRRCGSEWYEYTYATGIVIRGDQCDCSEREGRD